MTTARTRPAGGPAPVPAGRTGTGLARLCGPPVTAPVPAPVTHRPHQVPPVPVPARGRVSTGTGRTAAVTGARPPVPPAVPVPQAVPAAGTLPTTAGTAAVRLRLVPVTLRAAALFITAHHRHLGPPRGRRFAIGAAAGDRLVGVVVVGRPAARMLDDGLTAEVTRLCTTGHPNACSLLLGAARRATHAIGYRRLVTYTRAYEPGTSLRAAGWRRVADRPARPGWHTPSRARARTGAEHVARILWQAPGAGTGAVDGGETR